MIPQIEDNLVNESDFFDDFKEDVQEFEQPEIDVTENEPENETENKTVLAVLKNTNKLAAKTVVKTLDALFALLLSLYAISETESDYKLSKEEQNDFIELLQSAMPATKQALPDWVLIVLSISMIYGGKLRKANQDRETNLQNKHLKEAEYRAKLRKIEDDKSNVTESEN